ncbi:TldD/PmbA family protein [Coralloluteibacterium stylophorae]|uniref:TldD/PmbA family protein n=1 Tax=Coralloluteibacterium stylophorae TaxID=1776034 RepID=A0A8J8B0M6_9GAMM|nr:TldD/PmbA family protein [Coralloluteibacterium stylophorae]MBS7457492.1 TldD/PmbA family protein [Coralloluteibacterium stylophorae]
MTIYTEQQAREILEKVIALSTADETSATLGGSIDGNIRFALNNVSTSGVVSDASLAVQASFGKRTGTASINQFDDASLERVVRRAEELARLAPENPEYMPALPKQSYAKTPAFDESIAAITPEYRAQVAAASIEACRKENLIAAGFLQDGQNFLAIANSKGNFAYQRGSNFDYTCTVRTEDGTGSGWVGSNVGKVPDFDTARTIRTGIAKAKGSAGARALEPGKYTVILEPAAAAGLVSFMMYGFDARQADEGRSFLAKKGGGNKLGTLAFDPRVSIHADPAHPEAAVVAFDEEGLPRKRVAYIDQGKVGALQYSRYWAQKNGAEPTAEPGNLIMAGGTKSTAELVASTERGVLVSRTWYIRMVDPQTVLLTGLTRDGTFYIEDGEIKYPIKNFRFNESPVIMLNNVEELGRPIRVSGDESSYVMMIPPMKLRDFTFTSLSDAV